MAVVGDGVGFCNIFFWNDLWILFNLLKSQNFQLQNEKFQNSLMLLHCTVLTVICSASWELGSALKGCFEDNSVMQPFSILRFKWKQVITFVTVKFIT